MVHNMGHDISYDLPYGTVSSHLYYFLDTKPMSNLQGPREALVPRGGNHCGVSLITRVLHLGSRLWPATGAPARGGVRVRPTLAKVGRAKR